MLIKIDDGQKNLRSLSAGPCLFFFFRAQADGRDRKQRSVHDVDDLKLIYDLTQ